MKIDINSLCERVEAAVPTAKAIAVPEIHQVIVTFTNRPEVEIALLTPYQQNTVRQGYIDDDDLPELLFSLRKISNVP